MAFQFSRALLQFRVIKFVNAENFALSSRLCEVKAFSGSAESLRTPFKDSCANMSKSEIAYVSILTVFILFVNFIYWLIHCIHLAVPS